MPFTVKTVSDTVLRIVIILVSFLFAGGLVTLTSIALMKFKRYNQYKVVIWGIDGFGQPYQKTDKAGIFVDNKTKNKRFFIKKAKVGLNADSVPFIQEGKLRVVYLHQIGLKNFRFIKPRIEKNVSFEVGEEDVNWAVNTYERGKKVFSQDRLLQFMPYIILAFVSIIVLIIFIYLFRKLDAMVEFAEAAKEMTKQLAQIKTGTVVIE